MAEDFTRLSALDACLRAYGTGLSPALRLLVRGWDGPLRAEPHHRPAVKPDPPSNVVAFPACTPCGAKEVRNVRG
jgi:hypothetical protein